MDDVNYFTKELKSFRIFIEDIGIKFGIDKCAILIMNKGKKIQQKEYNYPIRKTSDAQRKRKRQIPGNISNRYYQINRDERKSKQGMP